VFRIEGRRHSSLDARTTRSRRWTSDQWYLSECRGSHPAIDHDAGVYRRRAADDASSKFLPLGNAHHRYPTLARRESDVGITMIDLELSNVSRRIVDELAAVEADEEVLIIADPEKTSVARALTNAARAQGATAILTIMPRLDAHGNEPPATVAEAMKTADVAFTVTTHAITHTRSRLAAAEAGTRIVVLRGVTEELMIEGGMNTDFEELREVTGATRDVLNAASEARVTSDAGTDVTMSLEDRSAFSLDGYFHNYGFSALPPGEAPTSPAEGTAQGTVVIDYSMDNVGLLDEPIELTFEDGFVTAVNGGSDADALREIVDGADENAGNMAEFAIGTNRDARLVGNLAEDKKKRGTVHFAIGDNESLGGTLQSDIHLDGLVLNPTVTLDNDTVLEDGILDVDRIRELAADLADE
jgi:leucyl aminopeptidase (aminopeptidase T)